MNTKKSARQQERTISALLSTDTIEAAARKAGISKRTIGRWLDEPEFRNAYSKAKRDVLRSAVGVLTRNTGQAAVILGKIFLEKPTENQSSRVAAAKATLKLAMDGLNFEDLEERLRRLENPSDDL